MFLDYIFGNAQQENVSKLLEPTPVALWRHANRTFLTYMDYTENPQKHKFTAFELADQTGHNTSQCTLLDGDFQTVLALRDYQRDSLAIRVSVLSLCVGPRNIWKPTDRKSHPTPGSIRVPA